MTTENRPALELIELNLSQILSTFGQVVLMYVTLYLNYVRQLARIAIEFHFEFLLYIEMTFPNRNYNIALSSNFRSEKLSS